MYLMLARRYQYLGCIFFCFCFEFGPQDFPSSMNLGNVAKEFVRYAGRAVGDENSGALAGVFLSWCPQRGDSGNLTALLPSLSGTATSAFLSVRNILAVCLRYSTSSIWHYQLCENYINYYYYYWYSALGPVWAETRVQSGDWYGSGTLHPGQVLRGSLPLLSHLHKL